MGEGGGIYGEWGNGGERGEGGSQLVVQCP